MKHKKLVVPMLFFLIISVFCFNTQIVGADATLYSSSSDGYLYYEDTSYATARNATSAEESYTSISYGYVGQQKSGENYRIWRLFFYFDTSDIPNEATILNANLTITIKYFGTTTHFNITIQNGQPTYPHNPLQLSDYDRTHYSGNGGYLDTTGKSTDTPYTINLTERSWVNKNGFTKLALRSSRDINSNTPTGGEYVRIYTSEQAGETYDPKLTVQWAEQYTFKGLYDETTGELLAAGVNVTAYYTDGSQPTTFEVNGTYLFNSTSHPQYFLFDLTSSSDIVSQYGLNNLVFSSAANVVSQYGLNLFVYNQSNYYNILFSQYEDDTDYTVNATLTWNSTYTVTDKTTTGCRINFGTPPTQTSNYLNWYVYRQQGQTNYYDILFGQSEENTDYTVAVTLTWNSTYTISNKATTGCRVNFGTPPTQNQYLNWYVRRTTEGTTSQRQYWVGSEEGSGTIYIFEATTTVYTIEFVDLAGVLDSYPFVEAQRYINGTLHTVERRKVDEEKKVSMALINGQKYNIAIKDGSSYTFGDLLFTGTTTVTLTLKGIDFPQNVILAYRYVRLYAERHNNFSSISCLYEDLDENTNHVDVFINYPNGTNAYNTTQTGVNSFNVTWASANYNITYVVQMDAYHNDYGTLNYHVTLPRGGYGQTWNLDWLGSIGDFNVSDLVSIFLVLCVALVFSKVNAPLAALLATGVAMLLSWLGWYSVTPAYLTAALFISIFMGLAYKKYREFGT